MTAAQHGDTGDEIARARDGDRDALEHLVRRSAEQIGRLIARRIGPALRERVRPSDILQSAYFQAIRDIEGFEGESEDDFVRWVGQIAENTIRMRARYFAAEKRRGDREVDRDSDRWVSPQHGPVSELQSVDELLSIGRSLEALPQEYRDVILMQTIDGLSRAEIAERLDRTESSVRNLLSRARIALAFEVERQERDAE